MSVDVGDLIVDHGHGGGTDAAAVDRLLMHFSQNRDRVFFSRQLEVLYENDFFHWVTNRALRSLIDEGLVRSETFELSTANQVTVVWHRSFRYYKRAARDLVRLIETYSDPNIGAALGLQGEALVLEGFATRQFVLTGRHTRSHRDVEWQESEHDLDMIFERDGLAYGVEVKNTLGYLDVREFRTKIRLCETIGVTPVFAARMLPRNWIIELKNAGGFALILKYQLYPWAHRLLAQQVRTELGLPVDSPRALASGTMQRFVNWHESWL